MNIDDRYPAIFEKKLTIRSLGYEILSNVCRLMNDPKGR